MRKLPIFLFCMLFLGCVRNTGSQISMFKDDGSRKPLVSIVPVIDHSASDTPWNLSDEFTSSISDRLISKGNILLTDQIELMRMLSSIDDRHTPFSSNIGWMPNVFKNQEFVVFLELVDHYLHTPSNQPIPGADENSSSYLDITMRVRLIDLRGSEPKIVLQELIHKNHNIPNLFAGIDYAERHWGKTTFHLTPIGFAHHSLTREIASRIEAYINIAYNQ